MRNISANNKVPLANRNHAVFSGRNRLLAQRRLRTKTVLTSMAQSSRTYRIVSRSAMAVLSSCRSISTVPTTFVELDIATPVPTLAQSSVMIAPAIVRHNPRDCAYATDVTLPPDQMAPGCFNHGGAQSSARLSTAHRRWSGELEGSSAVQGDADLCDVALSRFWRIGTLIARSGRRGMIRCLRRTIAVLCQSVVPRKGDRCMSGI